MIIRKANLNDLDNNLLKIYIDGFRLHYNGRPDVFTNKFDSELKEDLIDTIKKDDSVIVLEDENEIKGFLIYQIKERHSKTMWVDQLVVSEKDRHKGYGKILMNEIDKLAKKENCIRIEFCCWSFNNNAMNMYKHIGFDEQRVIFEKNVKY